jgi:hypothetical protein
MIGDVRFSHERDGYDVDGLVVVERLKDETMEVFDVDWSAAGIGGGLRVTFGQGVSWRTLAGRDAGRSHGAGAIGGASWDCARGCR